MGDSWTRQAQLDEKLALESIFGNDAVFPRMAWKVWKPLQVTIHLEPHHTGEEASQTFVSLDLHAECPESYPNSVPSLSVKNSKGLSQDDIKELLVVLNRRCNELIGTSMILDLCDVVSSFLYERNKPPLGSFHDVMLRHKENRDSLLEEEKACSEAREKEAVAEELERQQLEAEWRSEVLQTESADEKDVQTKSTTSVIGGREITASSLSITRPHHTFCREWFGCDHGQLLLISEYKFNSSGCKNTPTNIKDPKYVTLMRKLEEIDNLRHSISNLLKDEQTLLPYHFVAMDKVSLSPKFFNVTVYVAQKVEDDEKCFIECADSIRKENFLRRLSTSAVCALRCLHDHKLAHGCVDIHSLWCGKSSLRFSDYCLKRRLLSLCEYFKYYIGNLEHYNPADEKSKRTHDLRDLASLLKEIMTNKAFVDGEESLEELKSFISTCESAQNIEELINHQYFNHGGAVVFDSYSSSNSHHFAIQQKDSRLMKDFIIQKYLGKGAFGEVVQARNKLDWCDYAVKCITLDPMDDPLTRRITREAKLFSKLNHPNVVRYFNAWIETVTTAHTKRSTFSPAKSSIFSAERIKKFEVEDDSLLATRLRNLEVAAGGLLVDANEWTASCRGPEPPSSSDDSSDGESCDSNRFAPPTYSNSDSVSVLFENEKISGGSSSSSAIKPADSSPDKEESPPMPSALSSTDRRASGFPLRVLYIQMEYCDGGTLRDWIEDGDLRGNPRLIWRLFAEILTGLDYIHRQGMIHRDIKPMNILLDSEGHIKIGDFGLATRDLFLKKTQTMACVSASVGIEQALLTKDIGTEMYMAPELSDIKNSEPYTAKIDVYSTGIVLFEMCNPPFSTKMGRQRIIADLKKSMIFPENFGEGFSAVQAKHVRHLIEWMLKPDPTERPTAEHLLRDDHVPLVDIEDKQFKKIFTQAQKTRNRLYHWMVNALGKEVLPAARAYCYDQGICKEKFTCSRDIYVARLMDELASILRMHAFVPLNTHLLVPQSKIALDSCKSMYSKPAAMVDPHGYVTMLPMDLRQNFVRLCARNSINRIKRYVFDRVYANKDTNEDVHPSEEWECSVDCVGLATSASTLSADLLTVVSEIPYKILPEYKCTLSIGHMSLIEAALIHAGIKNEKKEIVLESMQTRELNFMPIPVSKVIESVGDLVGDSKSRCFLAALPKAFPISVFKDKCKSLLHSRNSKVKDAANVAISEMEQIAELLAHASNAKNIDIVFDGTIVYRPSTFADGIVFDLSCTLPSTRKRGTVDLTVLAGGRYDSLLKNELHPQDIRPAHSLCLVGLSISLNVLADIRRKLSNESPIVCDALVCSYSKPLLAEKFELANLLRDSGVRTDIMHEPVSSVPEILEHCVRSNIENLLVVFGPSEVLVMNNAIDHGKMTFTAAVDRLKKKTDEPIHRNQLPAVPPSPATFANCIVVYATVERPALNTKKKIENQIRVGLTNTFSQFSSSEKITLLVTSLPGDLIRSVATSINKGMTLDELIRVFDTICKSSKRSKEDMECLYEHMKKIFAIDRKTRSSVIIYRMQDGFFKVIN